MARQSPGTAVHVDVLHVGSQVAFVRVLDQFRPAFGRSDRPAQPASCHWVASMQCPEVDTTANSYTIVLRGIGSPRQRELSEIAHTSRPLALLLGVAQRRNQQLDHHHHDQKLSQYNSFWSAHGAISASSL